jgi:uncharacterized protein (TIGR02246 family)
MTHPNLEQELVSLETEYWRAMKDKDADAALRLTDDPCIVAGAQGVSTLGRDQMAAMLEAPNYTLDDFELSDPQVKLIGPDVAVLAYKVREELTVDGKELTLEAADASTWVRRGGHWVCALHTESVLGDPFGRDRNGRIPSAE